MKIKNKTQQKLLLIALMVLIAVIVYQVRNPIVIKKRVGVPVGVPVEVPVQIPVEREFRNPPIKEYKPGYVQQMGVLVGIR